MESPAKSSQTSATEIWRPSRDQIQNANITRFTDEVVKKFNLRSSEYHTLWDWSVTHPEQFWPEVWRFTGVVASKPWHSVLRNGEKLPGATWFEGAELNYAENLLQRRDEGEALVFWSETRARRALTFKGLYNLVSSLRRQEL